MTRHRTTLETSGELAAKRADQQVQWMWTTVRDRLMDRLRDDPAVRSMIPQLEAAVRAGELTASLAADAVLGRLGGDDPPLRVLVAVIVGYGVGWHGSATRQRPQPVITASTPAGAAPLGGRARSPGRASGPDPPRVAPRLAGRSYSRSRARGQSRHLRCRTRSRGRRVRATDRGRRAQPGQRPDLRRRVRGSGAAARPRPPGVGRHPPVLGVLLAGLPRRAAAVRHGVQPDPRPPGPRPRHPPGPDPHRGRRGAARPRR